MRRTLPCLHGILQAYTIFFLMTSGWWKSMVSGSRSARHQEFIIRPLCWRNSGEIVFKMFGRGLLSLVGPNKWNILQGIETIATSWIIMYRVLSYLGKPTQFLTEEQPRSKSAKIYAFKFLQHICTCTRGESSIEFHFNQFFFLFFLLIIWDIFYFHSHCNVEAHNLLLVLGLIIIFASWWWSWLTLINGSFSIKDLS